MDLSARDIARQLLAQGVAPGAAAPETRAYDEALSAADPEDRMTARVMRCAARELGIVVPDPGEKMFHRGQAEFLAAVLGKI